MNTRHTTLQQVGQLLWPEHLLQDASRGTWLQKAAALRHNRRQAHLLPPYILRWVVIAILLLDIGTLLPLSVWIAATILMMHAVSVAIVATITAIWLMLRSRHEY